MTTLLMNEKPVIVFDGVCNFCNSVVNFIIARDPEAKFRFSAMQTEYAQSLFHEHYTAHAGVDTFLLVKEGKCYICTDAALEIAKDLTGYWYLFNVFKIIPRSLRDRVYKAIARNRYALFGRTSVCMTPAEEHKGRFVEF